MRISKRPALLVAAGLAVAAVGTPAFAATAHAHPTSLNARATRAVVAPRHKDTVDLTLRSGKNGVAGETANFLVRSRRDVSKSAKWGAWKPVAATAGAKSGQYTVTVTMPAQMKKGQKEQFEVKFSGDPAHHLAASHSQAFTVKAS